MEGTPLRDLFLAIHRQIVHFHDLLHVHAIVLLVFIGELSRGAIHGIVAPIERVANNDHKLFAIANARLKPISQFFFACFHNRIIDHEADSPMRHGDVLLHAPIVGLSHRSEASSAKPATTSYLAPVVGSPHRSESSLTLQENLFTERDEPVGVVQCGVVI